MVDETRNENESENYKIPKSCVQADRKVSQVPVGLAFSTRLQHHRMFLLLVRPVIALEILGDPCRLRWNYLSAVRPVTVEIQWHPLGNPTLKFAMKKLSPVHPGTVGIDFHLFRNLRLKDSLSLIRTLTFNEFGS